MNERIRELAKKAYEDVIANTPSFLVTKDVYEEKFAELIIREIVDIFDRRAEPGTGFYLPQEPAEMIRQHFGVEE
jgi:hypothetical protein